MFVITATGASQFGTRVSRALEYGVPWRGAHAAIVTPSPRIAAKIGVTGMVRMTLLLCRDGLVSTQSDLHAAYRSGAHHTLSPCSREEIPCALHSLHQRVDVGFVVIHVE
jgi:hypothetical protein